MTTNDSEHLPNFSGLSSEDDYQADNFDFLPQDSPQTAREHLDQIKQRSSQRFWGFGGVILVYVAIRVIRQLW